MSLSIESVRRKMPDHGNTNPVEFVANVGTTVAQHVAPKVNPLVLGVPVIGAVLEGVHAGIEGRHGKGPPDVARGLVTAGTALAGGIGGTAAGAPTGPAGAWLGSGLGTYVGSELGKLGYDAAHGALIHHHDHLVAGAKPQPHGKETNPQHKEDAGLAGHSGKAHQSSIFLLRKIKRISQQECRQ